ncbi:hypothetical protein LTR22_026781 [Elasticomyces elasticus]|nr:hypothetical protein LTR22_026781 [Elasticomyces elasticus]
MTDLDRKRMCQYAKEHPKAKQKEIGGIFGVERRYQRFVEYEVLRHEEKYLLQDDGSRPLIKRAKGRTANVEKALGAWARNMKNNLLGARPRRASLAPEDPKFIFGAASTSHTQSSVGTSAVSPQGIGSPFHSQSATSLNSAFTDNTHSNFYPGPLLLTSHSYTPDSGSAPGPSPPLTARPILPAPTSSNAHRPRSQTFPQMDHYMGGTSSTETFTTQSPIAGVLDSPTEEALEPTPSTNDSVRKTRPVERSPGITIPHILANAVKREITFSPDNSSLKGVTSAEDALRAMQVVHGFIEQQPGGFLDYQESVTVGKLMEKLKLPP